MSAGGAVGLRSVHFRFLVQKSAGPVGAVIRDCVGKVGRRSGDGQDSSCEQSNQGFGVFSMMSSRLQPRACCRRCWSLSTPIICTMESSTLDVGPGFVNVQLLGLVRPRRATYQQGSRRLRGCAGWRCPYCCPTPLANGRAMCRRHRVWPAISSGVRQALRVILVDLGPLLAPLGVFAVMRTGVIGCLDSRLRIRSQTNVASIHHRRYA